MLRDDFFTDPNGGYPSFPNKKAFDRFWKKAKAYEETSGKCLDDGFTKDDYINLFNYMGLRQALDFANIKVALTYYISYLYDHGKIQERSLNELREILFDSLTLSDNKETIVYYKNLESLREAINKTVADSGRVDDSVHDVAVAALYMAWFGLPIEDVVSIKKSDVSSNGLIFNGQLLQVPDFVLEIWLRLKTADGFYQQARNVIFRKYWPSIYLLRTEKNEKLTLYLLRVILARFNAVTNKRFSLSYDVVYRSGIFNRAYRLECESVDFPIDDPEFAAEVFETGVESMKDTTKRRAKIKDYEYYKQLFR